MLCDIYRCGDEARYLANIMKRTKSVLNGLYWSWTTASHTQKRENHRKMSKVRILIFRKNTLDIDKNKQMNYLYFSKLILSSSWSSFIIICDSIGEGRWSKNCTNTLFCQVHTPSDPHPPPPPWFHRRPYFCSFFLTKSWQWKSSLTWGTSCAVNFVLTGRPKGDSKENFKVISCRPPSRATVQPSRRGRGRQLCGSSQKRSSWGSGKILWPWMRNTFYEIW